MHDGKPLWMSLDSTIMKKSECRNVDKNLGSQHELYRLFYLLDCEVQTLNKGRSLPNEVGIFFCTTGSSFLILINSNPPREVVNHTELQILKQIFCFERKESLDKQ